MAVRLARVEREEEQGVVLRDATAPGRTPDVDLEALAMRVERSRYVRWVKPAFERLVAAVLGFLLLPVIVTIAALLRGKLGRNILIRQQRVGLHGRPFAMYKFRTMLPDRRAPRQTVAVERRVCHKSPDDPRHTAIGKLLRRTGLDELPQLWNIVKGDMALVGPRPELVEIVERYEPWQHGRHLVRPGLTGLWQVSGRASGDLMHRHTEVDLEFVRIVSFVTDMRILGSTLREMTTGRLRGA